MRISRLAALTLLSVVAAAFIACSSPAADTGDTTPIPGEEPALVEVIVKEGYDFSRYPDL